MMDKEFITIREKETAVRVQNTKVNAVRMKDIVKKGVRVYKNGKIGISGAVGDISDEALVHNAIENLSAGIPYPYELSGNCKDYRDYGKQRISSAEIVDYGEEILAKLRAEYDDFSFSEGFFTNEVTIQMKNTQGLDLEYRDS